MRVSDENVYFVAREWIRRYGGTATAVASEVVGAMRRLGNKDVAETWLRIIDAIGVLRTPPTQAKP
jgi:hypothetical protein